MGVDSGEVLREEFLIPKGITAHGSAMALHVPAPRINDIVLKRCGVTADTAVRLARYLGTSADFWMGLQADFEMTLACKSSRSATEPPGALPSD